jgi:hypothetical protein
MQKIREQLREQFGETASMAIEMGGIVAMVAIFAAFGWAMNHFSH